MTRRLFTKKLWIKGTEIRYILAMNEKHSQKSRLKLIAIRNERGLTRQEVADLVEPRCHKSAIAKIERGEMGLTEEWAARLAKVYGCTASELLSDARVLTPDERELMKLAAQMTPGRRMALLQYARLLESDEVPKAGAPSE